MDKNTKNVSSVSVDLRCMMTIPRMLTEMMRLFLSSSITYWWLKITQAEWSITAKSMSDVLSSVPVSRLTRDNKDSQNKNLYCSILDAHFWA